jgi:hypothetical protein
MTFGLGKTFFLQVSYENLDCSPGPLDINLVGQEGYPITLQFGPFAFFPVSSVLWLRK